MLCLLSIDIVQPSDLQLQELILRRCSSNNAAVCGAVSVTLQRGVNFVWIS